MQSTIVRIADIAPIDAEVSRIGTRYLIRAMDIRLPDGHLPRGNVCEFDYCGRLISGVIVKATIERSDWNGDPSSYVVKLEVVTDPYVRTTNAREG
jgi:hypothetical protein